MRHVLSLTPQSRKVRNEVQYSELFSENADFLDAHYPRLRTDAVRFCRLFDTRLRTVPVWLRTCVPYQLNIFQTPQQRNLGCRVRDCALRTHSVFRPLEPISLFS